MGQKIKQTEIKEVIRSVVRENIKEVTTNDWHYKAIMSIWDKGGSFTRKKIAAVLCNDPKADRRDVENAIRNSGYDEVTDVTDRLRIEGIITEGEDNIPGGLAKGMTLNDIAEKHGVSVDILVAEFKKGIQTEMEHTTDREMAKEITMDHLFEDPQYYTKLATVEEYVDDKGVEHVAAALPQTEEEPIKEEESEETLRGLKEMAMGDLERIADYAKMILERMGSGQELDSWMYSQITLAVDQLNSVHDTMDGNDGIKESINELTGNERQIKNGNANNVFYVFYKGQFDAVYWAMNPSDLFNIYWDKFKVRRPAGSKFKLNPEFVIVPKKEYDNSTSNHYAKLKPYVDKFWDKLQNESTKEEWAGLDTIKRGGYGSPTLQNGDKVRMVIDARKNKYYNGVINGSSIKWEDGAKSELSLATQMSNRGDLQVLRPTNKNESVNEATEPEVITQIKTIAKNHQHDVIVDPKSGKKMRVDAFSASAIATVYDALSSSSKEKFLASGLLGMQQMAMKLLKR